MSRIAILGNAAGGKSTLSRRLAATRKLERIEIDELYWQQGWVRVPSEVYEKRHSEAIRRESWIIDGGGDNSSIERRLDRATEVILLDLPLWVHFLRAAERQIAWAQSDIKHPPGVGQDMPPTDRLFEMIWENDQHWMPKLRRMCDEQEALGKTVLRLTTVEALDAFYERRNPPP